MSPLRLNGSTSGYSQIDAPAVAGDQTFTLPGTGGTLDRLNRAGNILQVVQGSTSTATTIASTTFADTGLSASITPSSSSSKILVFVDQAVTSTRLSFTTSYGGVKLLRGSTTIHNPIADATGSYEFGVTSTGATGMTAYFRHTIMYLDSPNTTSATTYKTQGAIYYTANSGSSTYQPAGSSVNSTSYITLLEVAA